MTYIIANGDRYVHICRSFGTDIFHCDFKFETTLPLATRFKQCSAQNFIKERLGSEFDKWQVRKTGSFKSGNNFVVTDCTKFVGNGDTIENTAKRAKRFDTVLEACVYIREHSVPFTDIKILTENFESVNYAKSESTIKSTESNPEVRKAKRIAFTKSIRHQVYDKCGGSCGICGKPVGYETFTIDHITPLSRGGTNKIENLQVACKECNMIKSNSTDREFAGRITNILSKQLMDEPDNELSNILIAAIVRGKINGLMKGTDYGRVK